MSAVKLSPLESWAQRAWGQWISVERPLIALQTLRVLFFGLLTYDLWWIALSHAPRYGAGGFNVPHLGALSALSPSPSAIGALYIAGGLLSLLAAFGVGGRAVVGALAAVYNLSYFWSQADSYQHHYLLGLTLLIFCWAPLSALSPAAQREERQRLRLRHPGYDLLYLQMALIYFWTAVAKTEPVWLSGEVLNGILRSPEVRATVIGWGQLLRLGEAETFSLMAWGVMLGEYLAPLLFLIRPLRPLGFLIIPWFHISVEWVGFDIELFSYYMIALNLCLLSPAWLWRPLERAVAWGSASTQRRVSRPALMSAWLGALAVSAWALSLLPVEGASLASSLSVTLGALLIAPALWARSTPTAGALIAPLLIALCVTLNAQHMRSSSFAFDYYRMWGGDLSRRGEYARAVEIYQLANSYQATGPARHAALGSALIQLKRYQEASAAYEDDVLRWGSHAQAERQSGGVSERTIRGLKRAYEGWARSFELMGQQASATLILEQLQHELRLLSEPLPLGAPL